MLLISPKCLCKASDNNVRLAARHWYIIGFFLAAMREENLIKLAGVKISLFHNFSYDFVIKIS